MVDTEATIKLVRKLTDLTASGKMSWRLTDLRAKEVGRASSGLAYEGKDAYARFRLSRDERPLGAFESATSLDRLLGGPARTHRVAYRLELLDDQSRSRFSFPDVENIRDLYQAVRHQTSNVDKVLDHYLLDDEGLIARLPSQP